MMRLSDLILLPLAALWQQKSRTALTTLGVLFGAFVLAASLSINEGVQAVIERESRRYDALRQITVHSNWNGPASSDAGNEIEVEGEMSDEKRARIRQALAESRRLGTPDPVLLTPETVRRLESLEDVEKLEPHVWLSGFVSLEGTPSRPELETIESVRPDDEALQRRLVAGRFFEDAAERSVVVAEFLLYRWGLINDSDIEGALGKKLRIELRSDRPASGLAVYLFRPVGGEAGREETAALRKIARQLPKLLDQLELSQEERQALQVALEGLQEPPEKTADEVYSEELTIVGVIRMPTAQEQEEKNWWESLGGRAQVVLLSQTAAELFFRVPENRKRGLNAVTVVVDREAHVKKVLEQVREIGLQGHAALEFIESQRLMWLLVFGGMTCIAGVALLVAAVGIANTMLMSVLERTREIGIMKAVGAADAHITWIFLIEGALIGAVGAGLGLLLAWGASIPGDAWVRSMVARDMDVRLRETLFVFPPWLVATVIVFTASITTLAAFYPARRAARIDPVAALKYE